MSEYVGAGEENKGGWRHLALCRNEDPELFFPLGDETKNPATKRQVKAAKDVCRRCPVRAECLDWALEHDERSGIWGGLTERERKKAHNTHEEAQRRKLGRATASLSETISL